MWFFNCPVILVFLLPLWVNAEECTPPTADYLFVLDGTIDVGGVNFQRMKTFVTKFVERLTIGLDSSSSRLGVVQFTPRNHPEFYMLHHLSDKEKLQTAVNDISYKPCAKTDTVCKEQSASLNSIAQFAVQPMTGNRPFIVDVMIVITTEASRPPEIKKDETSLHPDSPMYLFHIMVGPNKQQELLVPYASETATMHIADFNDLDTLLDDVCDKVGVFIGTSAGGGNSNGNNNNNNNSNTVSTAGMFSSWEFWVLLLIALLLLACLAIALCCLWYNEKKKSTKLKDKLQKKEEFNDLYQWAVQRAGTSKSVQVDSAPEKVVIHDAGAAMMSNKASRPVRHPAPGIVRHTPLNVDDLENSKGALTIWTQTETNSNPDSFGVTVTGSDFSTREMATDPNQDLPSPEHLPHSVIHGHHKDVNKIVYSDDDEVESPVYRRGVGGPNRPMREMVPRPPDFAHVVNTAAAAAYRRTGSFRVSPASDLGESDDGSGSDDVTMLDIRKMNFQRNKTHLADEHPARNLPPVDVLIVVDNSGSIGMANFNKVKSFLDNFLDDVDISPGRSRACAVTFAGEPMLFFDFDKYYSNRSVRAAINRLPYKGGASFLGKALQFASGIIAKEQNLKNKRRKKKKARFIPTPMHDRLQVMVVVSDGISEDNFQNASGVFHEKLRVKVAAVGVRSFHREKLLPLTRYEGSIFLCDNPEALTNWLFKQQKMWKETYGSMFDEDAATSASPKQKPKKRRVDGNETLQLSPRPPHRPVADDRTSPRTELL